MTQTSLLADKLTSVFESYTATERMNYESTLDDYMSPL